MKAMLDTAFARLALSALFVGVLAASSSGRHFTLVEDGVSQAPIVVSADAPPWTEVAAQDLAEYVEKITGARPDVVVGQPDPIPERAVWVGYQPVLDELLPDVDLDFRHPEEIVIAARENHLVIAGRDVWDPDLSVQPGRMGATVEKWQQEYGTANAVYTFIQDRLDVRWLWPGEEDFEERATLALEPFTYRYHPPFRLRSGIFGFSTLDDNRGRAHEWARRQRVQLDSSRAGTTPRLHRTIGGHAFGDWYERFHETNPELLALQPDGSRGGFPSARNSKLCQSNPAVVEQWLDDVEEALSREPDRFIFNASPNDGHSSGICVCQDCLARDHPEGETRRYNWDGFAQEHVAMSDRYLKFANDLGRGLRRRFPDRDDFVVLMFAYGPSTPPPLGTEAEDNVMIGYVGHFPFTQKEVRQRQKEEWAAWAETAPMMAYRPNLWYWGGGVWGLPEVALEETAEDFRFLAEHNCFGILVDYNAEHWGTILPQYYLMAQLGWDPFADAEEILDEWYRRAFGPAAEAVKEYWNLLGEARRAAMAHPEIRLGSRHRMSIAKAVKDAFSPELLARAEAILDRAEVETADAPEDYGRRVAFVRTAFEFVQRMFQAAEQMERVRASEGEDTEAVRKALALWEEIKAISEREPLAMNFTYVRARMTGGGYMGGMGDFFGPPRQEFIEAAGLE